MARGATGRRRFLGTLAAALTLTLTVAGCSQGEGDQASSPSSATNEGTRTVTDVTGQTVQVPTKPQRVIALSERDLDAALALGVEPVGALNGRGQDTLPRYLGTRVEGITAVGTLNSPSIDKVVELGPDLILAGGVTDEQLLGQLRKIAPTVVTHTSEDDWKTALQRQADVLGVPDGAATVLADYDKAVQEVKAALGENTTAEVSIVRWNPKGPAYMKSTSFSSQVIGDLGLRRPASQQEAGVGHSEPLSLENLGLLDADWIFVGTLAAGGEAVDAMEQARNTPAFQALNAVRNNRLVSVDGSMWTSTGGPLAALAVLEDVRRAMAG